MESLYNENGHIVIAGSCALETREQLKENVKELKERGVRVVRASLWKPRTRPGWEGMGDDGISVLLEETIPLGLIPATEVMTGRHALMIDKRVQAYGKEARAVVWIGARNQNHFEQKEIARVLSTGSGQVYLMVKNQVWYDKKHWLGIFEHIVETGFPLDRLIMCHRGFSPGMQDNPCGYRNLPDMDMAMEVRCQTCVPMILDPSHIGGSRENVFEVMQQSREYVFDGYMVEVHCRPDKAWTDKEQQITPDQLEEFMAYDSPDFFIASRKI
ncbi:MAG: 3-deoxy-D-arabino-heptulosonate 7-phosphate (DAHP) synthase [Chlamydiales bacterium]|jgi:3-deoxy-D-arabino-heptulosonate 7-phosphate (DAHP) synthase